MPRRAVVLTAAVAGLVLMIATTAAPSGVAAACKPRNLRAAFVSIRGSAGAGQISYAVRLTNRHAARCTVSGRPGLRLLDRHGHALPTHVVPDNIGTGMAVLVTLSHNRTAVADARFSPDVPGPGEQTPGACEHRAFHVRVTLASPGHGSLVGKVKPVTSVCEHGRIVLGLLHLAG